ncbi:MAG: histidinol phosphatase and related phosphatase [Rhodospirillaceae bacterium]|nr:MAG: histidinol phosphatase and related phosphatase [Rhodospirillaceae bacterium]
MTRRYVLLDRDGTINVEAHYLSRPEQVVLLPGAVEGLRRLQSLGLGLIVLSNQSGIARGYFDMAQLEAVNARLNLLLAQEGVRLDGLYVCPHGPEEACACRKPRPGLVERAVRDHGFDPEAAYMVGDKLADIALGQAVQAVTILVRTGYGAAVEREGKIMPDFVADSLADAAILIERRGYSPMSLE